MSRFAWAGTRQVRSPSDVSEHLYTVPGLQDGMRDGKPSFCPQRQPEWSAFREASFGHVSKGSSCDNKLVPTLQSSNKPLSLTSCRSMLQGMLEISPERLKWAWFRNHGGQRMAADEVGQ